MSDPDGPQFLSPTSTRPTSVVTADDIRRAVESLWAERPQPAIFFVHPRQKWALSWTMRWLYHTRRLSYPAWWRRLPRFLRWRLYDRRARRVHGRFAAWLKAHPERVR